MQRHEWSVPAGEPSQGRGGQSSDASALTRGIEYVVRIVCNLIFFGAIGIWFSSWFPTALGLFLFFTKEEFIEWVLQMIGIRFVPGTLGPEFIKSFVFLLGLWTLLAYWRDSAPAWLSPWVPPDVSWYVIGGAAVFCAVLKIISVAVAKKLLPQVGIEILSPNSQNLAILVVLGVLLGLTFLVIHLLTP